MVQLVAWPGLWWRLHCCSLSPLVSLLCRPDFVGALTILGIWATFGALVGQGRCQCTPPGHHLERKRGAMFATGVMFLVAMLVYGVKVADEPGTPAGPMVGMLVLAIIGVVLGFVAGADGSRCPHGKADPDGE